MGLSKEFTKTDISTFQIILTFAQKLEQLISDPKALDKAAKAAFALSDAEEAKAATVKKDLADNGKLISELLHLRDERDAEDAALNAKKESTQAIFDSIRKEQARLAAVDVAQGKRALELEDIIKDVKLREAAIENNGKKQDARALSLEKREKDIVEGEKALKEKAAKLRGLMDA